MARTFEPEIPFSTAKFARGPHAQMIVAHALEHRPEPPGSIVLEVPLSDGDRLAVVENHPPNEAEGGVLLLHGLGGSSWAKYMISAADRLIGAGFSVFRMNFRGAGPGAMLSSRLYNAGLSCDIAETLRFLGALYPRIKFVCVGFSMSGNTLLKFLSETDALRLPLIGALAVNPAADLSLCMKAIEHPLNYFYHLRFTKLLVRQRLANEPPEGRLPLAKKLASVKSIRGFDTTVTCPTWGFCDPEHYYRSQSAVSGLSKISVPTILFTSKDDPLIPVGIFTGSSLSDAISLYIAEGGGHMGYLSEKLTPFGDRRYQDYFVVEAVRRLFSM